MATLPIIPGYYDGSIDAKLIGLKMNGQFFKCETGCTFNFEVEMLPASSIQSGYYEESIPGRINWSMTINGNLNLAFSPYNDFKSILDKVKARERVFIEMITRNGINPYFGISGYAWPQNGQWDAQVGSVSTYNTTFKGDGEFFTDYEQFALIINQMPASATYPDVFNIAGGIDNQ